MSPDSLAKLVADVIASTPHSDPKEQQRLEAEHAAQAAAAEIAKRARR